MLPYASYLRIYEPLTALSPSAREAIQSAPQPSTDVSATLVMEQTTVLKRAMSSSSPVLDEDPAGTYVIRVGGRSFYCPSDMPLRSWLSLTSLVNNLGGSNVALLFPGDSLVVADEKFLSWRRAHPDAVPHVRQATWGVPRTWFTLVAPEERRTYDAGGFKSIRYRTRILDASSRITSTLEVLENVLDEEDLLEEVNDLVGWLEAFSSASWVELDYAGIARCLGSLGDDHSAGDIHESLEALSRGDWAAAGDAYRRFEARWRLVNAFERVN